MGFIVSFFGGFFHVNPDQEQLFRLFYHFKAFTLVTLVFLVFKMYIFQDNPKTKMSTENKSLSVSMETSESDLEPESSTRDEQKIGKKLRNMKMPKDPQAPKKQRKLKMPKDPQAPKKPLR